jgi:hypothetical protein
MLEVEAVPQSCIPEVQIGFSIALYKRSSLLVESFDLRPSNHYILVRVIPGYFRFAKMCLCQVSLLSDGNIIHYLTNSMELSTLKSFPAFYVTRRFITVFTRAPHLSLS